MNTVNYGIMWVPKYESSGGMQLPRSMVTQRWRSCDMSTIRIPLNSRKYTGLYALIDEADLELVGQYRWWPKKRKHTFYAVGWVSGFGQITMHQFLYPADGDNVIDHVNRDGLDNRRSNLRHASKSENQANADTRVGVSGYKGVTPGWNSWRVQVQIEGRKYLAGAYTNKIAAANAYDLVAPYVHRGYAVTNKEAGMLEADDVMTIDEIESYRTPYSKSRGMSLAELITALDSPTEALRNAVAQATATQEGTSDE